MITELSADFKKSCKKIAVSQSSVIK